MLGSDVCEVLADGHEVAAFDVGDFDITDYRSTVKVIHSAAPDVVLHLAAFTDVDACEEEANKSAAYEINANGTKYAAAAAGRRGSRLVYVSTDYVFDGTKDDPYIETDEPNPINAYGQTKLYGELFCRKLAPNHLIVRTSWLFGPEGRNFVDRIIEKATETGRVSVVDDQRGCPTYTMDLARAIRQVIELGLEGVIHLTNSGTATWFELAKHALALSGVDAEVLPVNSDAYPTKAKRPKYSVLGSVVTGPPGLDPVPDWRDGVKRHLARRGLLKGSAVN
jgi:dTDP-4-dehydrorhamnose reductase